MKPKKFKEQNVIFGETQSEYQLLPACKNEIGDIVTCWEVTEEEMEALKRSKCIYLAIKTFNQPFQPVYLTVDKRDVFDVI